MSDRQLTARALPSPYNYSHTTEMHLSSDARVHSRSMLTKYWRAILNTVSIVHHIFLVSDFSQTFSCQVRVIFIPGNQTSHKNPMSKTRKLAAIAHNIVNK